MTKISNLFKLANLLSHRQTLSVKAIQNSLGISRRTVFRYLNSLSEADIPVYYDSSLRGYTLTNRQQSIRRKLSPTDATLIHFSLERLKSSIAEGYRKLASDVIELLMVEHPELNATLSEQNLSQVGLSADNLAQQLTLRIITVQLPNNSVKHSSISNPGLNYQNGWRLVDRDDRGFTPIPFERIKTATIAR